MATVAVCVVSAARYGGDNDNDNGAQREQSVMSHKPDPERNPSRRPSPFVPISPRRDKRRRAQSQRNALRTGGASISRAEHGAARVASAIRIGVHFDQALSMRQRKLELRLRTAGCIAKALDYACVHDCISHAFALPFAR